MGAEGAQPRWKSIFYYGQLVPKEEKCFSPFANFLHGTIYSPHEANLPSNWIKISTDQDTKTHVHTKTYTQMLTVALFTTTL